MSRFRDASAAAEISVPVEALWVVVQGGAADQAHLDQAIQVLRARLAEHPAIDAVRHTTDQETQP